MRVSGPASARNLVGPALHSLYRIRLGGAHLLPARGGVLLVANHEGIIDATLLAVAGPRPVRVVSEGGTLPGVWRRMSGLTGRIVIAGADDAPAGLRAACSALAEGEAVGMFPMGPLPESLSEEPRAMLPGVAYVQVTTGVPVVPVALLGTHGDRPTDPPVPRSTIDIVVGDPFQPVMSGDPRARATILDVAEVIRQHLTDHMCVAMRRTGRSGDAAAMDAHDNGGS